MEANQLTLNRVAMLMEEIANGIWFKEGAGKPFAFVSGTGDDDWLCVGYPNGEVVEIMEL